MIITDKNGRPIDKPRREDFKSDAEFARAFAQYKDRISQASSQGSDEGAHHGMAENRKGNEFQREPDDEVTRKRKVAEMMRKWAKSK